MAALRALLLVLLAPTRSTPSTFVTVSSSADGVWWLERDNKPFFSTGVSNLNDGAILVTFYDTLSHIVGGAV
jgi:hypothetical protein